MGKAGRTDRPPAAPSGTLKGLLGALGLAALLAAGGCGLLGQTVGGMPGAAHVVALTRPDCPSFVVKTYNGRYAVLRETSQDYVPGLSDLLEGPPLQIGREVLRYYPPAEVAVRDGDFVPVEVAVDLPDVSLPEAQRALTTACGPAPAPGPTAIIVAPPDTSSAP